MGFCVKRVNEDIAVSSMFFLKRQTDRPKLS